MSNFIVRINEAGYVVRVAPTTNIVRISASLPGSASVPAHTHSTDDITSGTFDDARIPALAASKITSGTLDAARIPTLPAGDISGLGSAATLNIGTATGTVAAGDDSRLSDARTPVAHSADLVTSGTLSVDRIPAITLAKVSDAGTAASKDTGTGATNVILGNDARLTDDRTPVAHSADLVTSGTLGVDRIPTLTLAKVSDSGTAAAADTGTGSTNVILGNDARLTDARTPVAHSADLVTSGTLGVDRIPTITLAKVSDAGTAAAADTGTGSSNVILGNDSRLTDARTPTTTLDHDAAKITSGTLAVARGGTGSATAPMVGLITAADAAAARTVLGVGTGSGDMVGSNNLSDLTNFATARTNLGVPETNHSHATGNITSGTFADARIAASNVTQHADQISIGDLSNVTQTGILATNSGIYWSGSAWVSGALAVAAVPTITLSKISDSGGAAALDVGTSSGTVCAGDDSRLSDDRDPTAHSTDKLTSGTLAATRGGTGLTSISTLLNSNQAYSDISGTPTLGTASASATGDFVAASAVSTFGSTLISKSDATSARSTLGLSTAATASSTSFATSSQGTKADSALQDLVDDTAPELGGHFDVKAQKVFTSTANGTIAIVPKGSGGLEVGGNHDSAANVGKISWMCEVGTHGVSIKGPPHSAAATYELVLPTATGTADQALKTDGSGNLGWSSFVASSAVSTFGGTLIDDTTAGDARTTLGATTVGANVFTAADQAAARSAIGVGTGTGDMVASNNLSDVDSVSTARTNLGATTVGANVFTAADAAAARSAIGAGSGTGDLVASNNLSDLNSAATARTNLGVSNTGSYTGQIETAADKTYTLDPVVATARTISAFYVKTGAGSVVVNLKNGTNVVKQVTAGTGTGNQTSLANTSLAADAVLTLVLSSNSSATDVIFSVEYTE